MRTTNKNNKINNMIMNSLYLVDLYLDKKGIKDEDIRQQGYVILIESIKRYFSKKMDEDIEFYLNQRLEEEISMLIKNKQESNKLEFNDVCFVDDFITDFEEKEYVEHIEDFIFNTDYFTFLQKNFLMAKLGLIGNYPLKNHEIAEAFGCTNTNVYKKFLDCKLKLKNAILNKEDMKKHDKHTDLFAFFKTSKQIVLDLIKKELTDNEIRILKLVWKDDFSGINDLSKLKLTEEETIFYYNSIGKLYKAVINVDLKEEANYFGLNYCYALRR